MAIRRATAADAKVIAAIHVAAYDETYRGLAPPEVFEGLNLERRTAQCCHAVLFNADNVVRHARHVGATRGRTAVQHDHRRQSHR